MMGFKFHQEDIAGDHESGSSGCVDVRVCGQEDACGWVGVSKKGGKRSHAPDMIMVMVLVSV